MEKNKLRLCIYKGLIVIPVAMENQEEHKEKKEDSTVASIVIPVAMEIEHEHKEGKEDSAVVKSQMEIVNQRLVEETNSINVRLSKIEARLEDIETDLSSTITCRVCWKHAPIEGVSYVNVLGCGHAYCNLCAFGMLQCPTCKAPVVGKFKLFI